jgi:hypothetical protein
VSRPTHRSARATVLLGCLGVAAVVATALVGAGDDGSVAAEGRGHPGAEHGSLDPDPRPVEDADTGSAADADAAAVGRDGRDEPDDGDDERRTHAVPEDPAPSRPVPTPAVGFDGLAGTPDLAPATTSEEGFLVAPEGPAAGTGGTVTYTVELEPAVAESLRTVVDVVEDALHDDRSWASEHRLDRVDEPEAADVRVLLATPDTVDALCAEAGLDTGGSFSCWNGAIAALNATRWEEGAAAFDDDLTTYRRYLVNHEVGHGLGHAHEDCPAAGELAPVMMQQSMDTGDCEPNGWVHPQGADAGGS